jgi:putative addiction module CopG family antidote
MERMAIHIHLTPELEQLVQDQVRSGRFRSTSELVCDALLAWTQRERTRHERPLEPSLDDVGGPGRRLAA